MLLRALFLFLLLQFGDSIDTITPAHPLKEDEVLTSKGGKLTLGFFSPGNSSQRYVGIWFTKVSAQTVVWVANRDKPIIDSSGVLSINRDGNLRLSSQENVVWTTNMSVPVLLNDNNSTSCQLLDTGNLVLTLNSGKTVVWQSFDYPTDTFLPGMKLGLLDKRTGLNHYLTSWRSTDDPSPGKYLLRVDPNGSPQFFLYQGPDPIWRTSLWIEQRWIGVPETPGYIFDNTFVSNSNEITITYSLRNDSIISIFVVDGSSGTLQRRIWDDNSQGWIQLWSAPKDLCDQYGHCGDYGSCNPNIGSQFECSCFPGYKPKSPRDWYLRDGSQGCVREENISMCRNGEGFLKLASVKLPDTSKAVVNTGMTMKECEEECLKNCSCMAYTAVDESGRGSGCIALYGQLIDTIVYSSGGKDLYFRVNVVELAKYLKSKGPLANKRLKAVLIVLAVLMFAIIVTSAWFWVHKKKKREREVQRERTLWIRDSEENDANSELPFFSRSEIAAATNDFSSANKLGEGGFGSVYKGRLHNGLEVAVKKLAQNSGQGIQEFKNEVRLIAKLQHRNLVKMLGCCIEGEEKMLIYEIVPNKSLNTFIFKEEKRSSLDWRMRLDIILGIARGMLYLHQDSRLRIIHRDLKASNVLLDNDMVPKISDFGTARIFGGNQVEDSTTRVVGTYGYMAPEYALQGLISVKSDVFSFGVLLLEIISGRKNSGHYHDNPSINLIGHVWDLWRDDDALNIVDPSLNDPDVEEELLRCIQIGLLCVQQRADDRPTMSEVVFMLSNKMELSSPNQPAYIHTGSHFDGDPPSSSSGPYSLNEMSVTNTMVEGR